MTGERLHKLSGEASVERESRSGDFDGSVSKLSCSFHDNKTISRTLTVRGSTFAQGHLRLRDLLQRILTT